MNTLLAKGRVVPHKLIETVRALVTDAVDEIVKAELPLQRSCLDCAHFDEPSERCKVADARPPARVIAFGCERFVLNDIPW